MDTSVAIYLAGPMLDYTGDHHSQESKNWREELARWEGLPSNVLLVSPAHAFFNCSPDTAAALDGVERYMINACGGVLANLTTEHPAFGTIRDIEFAVRCSIPVAVAGDVKSLMAYDVIVEPTVEDAMRDLLLKIADLRNAPPSMFALPMMIRREPPSHDDV